jgi:hypothetical protein
MLIHRCWTENSRTRFTRQIRCSGLRGMWRSSGKSSLLPRLYSTTLPLHAKLDGVYHRQTRRIQTDRWQPQPSLSGNAIKNIDCHASQWQRQLVGHHTFRIGWWSRGSHHQYVGTIQHGSRHEQWKDDRTIGNLHQGENGVSTAGDSLSPLHQEAIRHIATNHTTAAAHLMCAAAVVFDYKDL